MGLDVQGRQLIRGHFWWLQGLLLNRIDFRVTPTLSMIRTLVVHMTLNLVSALLSILDRFPSWVLGIFNTVTTFLRSGTIGLLGLLLLGFSSLCT